MASPTALKLDDLFSEVSARYLEGMTGEARQPLKYRKLRIGWSVGCGLLAFLLIALWVRSYYRNDWVYAFRPSDWHHLQSIRGELVLQVMRQRNSIHRWGLASAPSSELSNSEYGWNLKMIRPQHEFGGFVAFNSPKISAYAIPHWFLVLLFAAFSGAPWISKFNSRFSLRTLLIGMTMLAAILGLIVWTSR